MKKIEAIIKPFKLDEVKEALQAGVRRVVFEEEYGLPANPALRRQYGDLAGHLSGGDPTRFERLVE